MCSRARSIQCLYHGPQWGFPCHLAKLKRWACGNFDSVGKTVCKRKSEDPSTPSKLWFYCEVSDAKSLYNCNSTLLFTESLNEVDSFDGKVSTVNVLIVYYESVHGHRNPKWEFCWLFTSWHTGKWQPSLIKKVVSRKKLQHSLQDNRFILSSLFQHKTKYSCLVSFTLIINKVYYSCFVQCCSYKPSPCYNALMSIWAHVHIIYTSARKLYEHNCCTVCLSKEATKSGKKED